MTGSSAARRNDATRDEAAPRAILDGARAEGLSALDEKAGKTLLAAYGVSVPSSATMENPEQAARACEGLRAPFAVKVLSSKALHKSDLGGLRLGLADAAEVRDAAEEIRKSWPLDAPEIEGFLVDHRATGPDVWAEGETGDYSAIILDLGLPGMDGLSILKRWRAAGVDTPIMVLTARGSWMERVDGFDAGADDYLPKPFRNEELLARLKALLRRAGSAPAPSGAGRFRHDETRRMIFFDGNPVELSPQEYRGAGTKALDMTAGTSESKNMDSDSAEASDSSDPNGSDAQSASDETTIPVVIYYYSLV